MKRLPLLLILALLYCNTLVAAPLRIFIRSGPKSHGPGAHDHPAFLRDWVPLLNARGANATGGDVFPSEEQLAATDVLIIHRDGGGDLTPEDAARLTTFTQRGGGLMVIHAGCYVAAAEKSDFYKQLIGGSWRKPMTRFKEGPMKVYFHEPLHPIVKGCNTLEMDDEIYFDMDLSPEIQVLASAYTPKPVAKGQEPAQPELKFSGGESRDISRDLQPQLWTYEKAAYRAFVCIPGHIYTNFANPEFQNILLRGIAWAGKRENIDELCSGTEGAPRNR